MTAGQPVQVDTFTSFSVNQVQKFDIHLANQIRPDELIVTITNPILGQIDQQLEWLSHSTNNSTTILSNHASSSGQPATVTNNRCVVSFRAPIVGVYTINVELINQPQYGAQFQAKAYDLSKVFINGSSGKCFVNDTYEFSVDASEAGEGQLEIAVNEGEIPNQVQVLDNGKCIVNFIPEDGVPHVVDIKFNGHNVNGCPFVVEVSSKEPSKNAPRNAENTMLSKDTQEKVNLVKEDRLLVDTQANIVLENISLNHEEKSHIQIYDPENKAIHLKVLEDAKLRKCTFEFLPKIVGDYRVDIVDGSSLLNKLPQELKQQFPFMIKVFDFKKVIVSDVTNGVIGHPVYFFIDASLAGSGNLEIRVSTKNKNVPNVPQSESNAKIRVNFTPTEAVDHHIDVKFNAIPVPGSPFPVKVAHYPQARLPVTTQDLLKYIAIDEDVTFYVDYIGSKENRNLSPEELSDKCCQVMLLRPDFKVLRIESIQLKPSHKNDKQMRFKVTFKATKIGPHKLFITVNNELLPTCPVLCNVYNIKEVKVYFNEKDATSQGIGYLNKPVTFTVDASRAGEGTLALAVVSSITRNPVQTDVQVSDKGHGLYNLTFVPNEFAPHSIDMSFNDRLVPMSPFKVDVLDSNGLSASEALASSGDKAKTSTDQHQQKTESKSRQDRNLVQDFETLNLNSGTLKSSKASSKTGITSRKSLAFGLINASNVVYLESGVLENNKNQVSLEGPNGEEVPFAIMKGAPSPDEPKKAYIEYKPKSIGTHTINVLEGKDLRQYLVQICDPSLIRVSLLDSPSGGDHLVGRPVRFCIDSQRSGEIQLDSITISGPSLSGSSATAARIRDGESTLLGRFSKSITASSSAPDGSPSASSSSSQAQQPIHYSVTTLSEHKQELKFVPQVPGRYSIDIRCLGQPVGQSPYQVEVSPGLPSSSSSGNLHQQQIARGDLSASAANNITSSNNINNTLGGASNSKGGMAISRHADLERQLLENIVVHGISLKHSPVNSTGAFIIETNRIAQARDFDVLITDPNNSLVDVQCYLQQDGNLLAEWTPKRVGTHKIEVLYKDQQVNGSPFVSEAFDPSGVIIENLKSTHLFVNERVELRVDRKEAGCGELDVAITSPVGQDLPIDIRPLEVELSPDNYQGEESSRQQVGEIISFVPSVAGKYKMSIAFCGYEIPKSPINFSARESSTNSSSSSAISKGASKTPGRLSATSTAATIKVSGAGLRGAEVNRSAQFQVESQVEGQLKLRIECGDREIVPKVEQLSQTSYSVKYKPTEIGYTNISLYWNGSHICSSPYSVPVNDLGKIVFLGSVVGVGGTKTTPLSTKTPSSNQALIDYEPRSAREVLVDASRCGPGELKAEAYCRANPAIKFTIPVTQLAAPEGRFKLTFVCPPRPEQLARGISMADISLETTYLIRLYYNNLFVPEQLASLIVSPAQKHQPQAAVQANATISSTKQLPISNNNNNNIAARDQNQKCELMTEVTSNGKSKVTNGKHNDTVSSSPIVALRGHGLADARCGEPAEFTIDGSEAGLGRPEVRLAGPSEQVTVRLDEIEPALFRAEYVPKSVGSHTLNVLWDGKQVAGCPITINVLGASDPKRVICTGDGLKGGILGDEIKTFIDTRRAGPGELTALCTGPAKVAFCELLDRGDGTFILYVKPQESGRHLLTIKYGGEHIPKSPFLIKVSGRPDSSKVRVHGPGVEHGVLSLYQSRFVCDTRGAGAGQLTVRIRGPKGAFRMETQREGQRDRTILCKYDPTEPGDYRIEIKWSGKHVPGSPFSVMIFDTQEELNRYLKASRAGLGSQNTGASSKFAPASVISPMIHANPHHQVPYQPDYVYYAPGTGAAYSSSHQLDR